MSREVEQCKRHHLCWNCEKDYNDCKFIYKQPKHEENKKYKAGDWIECDGGAIVKIKGFAMSHTGYHGYQEWIILDYPVPKDDEGNISMKTDDCWIQGIVKIVKESKDE